MALRVAWVFSAVLLLPLWFGVSASEQVMTNDTALRWGPYRPNLYLGFRPLIPETLLMGLMWANGDSEEALLRSEAP